MTVDYKKVLKKVKGMIAIERGQHQVRSGQLRCCDVEGRPVLFPEVEVKGCVFHWTQAVWRQRQNLGTAEQLHLRCHHPDLHQEAVTTTLSAWPTHHDDVRQAKGEGHPGWTLNCVTTSSLRGLTATVEHKTDPYTVKQSGPTTMSKVGTDD